MSADSRCSPLSHSPSPPILQTLIWRCPRRAAGVASAASAAALRWPRRATRSSPLLQKPPSYYASLQRSTINLKRSGRSAPSHWRGSRSASASPGPRNWCARAHLSLLLAFTPGPSWFAVLGALRTRIMSLQRAVPPRLVQRPWIPTPVPTKRGRALAERIAIGGRR
jgi:hypothetical protein